MYGTSYEIYKEIDPAKKDPIWGDKCITILRRDWVPLVNQSRCRENKRLLDSMQSLEEIEKKFKDKEFKKELKFDPIGVMEVFKNTLIEDILKAPPKAELKATDASAMSDKKKDIELLKNRKIVEKDINKYQSQVYDKMPPYQFAAKNFKGNVSEFDRLNLNENNPEDLTFYEQELQRLNYEIAGQSVVNNVLKTCRFDQDTTMKLVRDVLAVRAIVLQTYVDKLTGEIKARYIYPETFYGIFGAAGDGKDDICVGWTDNISINEWLQFVGNEFEWDRDWRKLLWAINYCGNTKYTGFIRNNIHFDCCGNSSWMKEGGLDGITQSNLLDWTMAFNYQINCGYIEWKTEEATSTMVRSKVDTNYVDVIPYSYELDEKKKLEGYYKYSNYQQQTYGSYFISTTSVSQWIFGFGKVYYQTLHGANDEYSSGTLKYYMLPGKSAVEIARPYIRMANNAFYKMLWAIDKAKPEEDVYVYDELVQIAKKIQRSYNQSGTGNAGPALETVIKDTIAYQRENLIRLRAYPQVEGRPVVQLPTLEGKRNGLDPVYISMQSVLAWAEFQIGAKIGVNPMRTGMNPPPRESQKSEMNTIEASINATSYIYRMIQYTKERVATDILNLTQDIIKFKDSIPYKWVKKIVGQEDFAALFLLEDYAAHRFGIFIRDYNSDYQKKRVEVAADQALAQKQIEVDQWYMITQAEDYKMSMKLLSLYRRKKEQKERRQALEDMKVKQEGEEKLENLKHQNKVEELQLEIKKAQIQAQAVTDSAHIQSDGRIKVKELTIEGEGPKQADKAQATKEINSSKEQDKESKPFPAVAGGQ